MEHPKRTITGSFVILGVLGFIISQTIFSISNMKILSAILIIIGVAIPVTFTEILDISKQIE